MASERKIIADNVRRVLLKEYMMKETQRAGFGGLDIQRTPMGTRITLFTERPGLVIGRRGGTIKVLTDSISSRFKFDNPQIEVEEVPNPALNAQIMSEKLASALERGWHFRRAGHSTLRRIMEAGAKGCLVRISGKLTGQRHRTEKFKAGHIKYCGEPKALFLRQGFSVAKLKPGVIGVTVWIMDPNARLPDEIKVKEPGALAVPEAAVVPLAPVVAPPPEAPAPRPEVPVPAEAVEETKKVAKRRAGRKKEKPKEIEEKILKKVKREAKEIEKEVVDIVIDEDKEEGAPGPDQEQ
jgi:small subunit ribosomal protein S3